MSIDPHVALQSLVAALEEHLTAASQRLAAAMPQAEYLVVPESKGHRLDAVASARIVADRLVPPRAA